jgi:uncharacterized protein DUF222
MQTASLDQLGDEIAAWLAWRVGLDLGAARERVRVARALGTLPLLAQALARGALSYAKVRALTRIATPETEAQLLAFGRAGTAAHVERLVRGWRLVDRHAEARETARRHASRALHVYQDEDGMVTLRGRLTPEVGALRPFTTASIPAPGVRCKPGGHAAQPRRPCRRSCCTNENDSSGVTACTAPPRPRLPLPRLRRALRPGSSHPSLGGRRPDDVFEPGTPLSPSPSCRPRGGVRGRSTAGRRAPFPPPRRAGLTRRPASSGSAPRRRKRFPSAAPGRGASLARGHHDAGLAG